MSYAEQYDPHGGVAIVGMAGRFPGARDVNSLWHLLEEGRTGIRRFAPSELEDSFPEDMQARAMPGYVAARGTLDAIDHFDEGFFGFSPAEAALLDPQQRLFMQACWEALEDAHCDPERFDGLIGVYAGATANSYYLNNLQGRRDVTGKLGLLATQMANQEHYLATRVAYKLNLRGPAMSVQTACSTSLVAVATAVQSLLAYQCDAALAGGVSVTLPQQRGYAYQEGSILSPDGECRPFDEQAAGTVFSNGLGVVVLRRLADALAAGDRIYAVIKGAALNNDGHSKLSFTAPSVTGQAECVAMAQAMAGIDPQTIQYVEAHGTGTALGDPIEVRALTQAFRAGGARGRGFCALGSLKASIGHLDAAAGVAGLIRTALALHHQRLPGQPNFSAPHPQLELEESPFVVISHDRPWLRGTHPRRAAVSSLGVGGTNAHLVLEEAPTGPSTAAAAPAPPGRSARPELLLLSAHDADALQRTCARLVAHLNTAPSLALRDQAQSLHLGRRAFPYRFACVADSLTDAVRRLGGVCRGQRCASGAPRVAFLFSGQGAQRVNTWRGLYEQEPVFRTELDACVELLLPVLKRDLRELLFPAADQVVQAQSELDQTRWTQPALVSLQVSLSRLFMHWGVQPVALLGHSIGEWTAAHLAGTFSLRDTLTLVAERGRLMQMQPRGAMLAVRAGLTDLQPWLGDSVVVAANNAPRLQVLAGPTDDMQRASAQLQARGFVVRELATSHAFHSPLMDGMLGEFEACVARVQRAAPRLPWVSSLTGDFISAQQALSAEYWARQLRQTVQFSQALATVLQSGHAVLDLGPGDAMARLARQQPAAASSPVIVSAAADGSPDETRANAMDPAEADADLRGVLSAAGALWCAGVALDAHALRPGADDRSRLPSYAFAENRHWIEPAVSQTESHQEFALGALPAAQEQPETKPLSLLEPMPTEALSSPSEHVALMLALKELVADLCGLPATSLEPQSHFLELGLDSLAMTQLAQAIQKRWNVRVPLRRLLEDLTQLEALANWLAPQVAGKPAVHGVATSVAAVATHGLNSQPPEFASAGANGGQTPVVPAGLAELFAQQLAVMNRQLDMVGGAGLGRPSQLAEPVTRSSILRVLPAAESVSAPLATPATVASEPATPTSPSFGPYRPPQTQRSTKAALEGQTAQLSAFVARYNAHTAESKRLAQASRDVLADPRSVAGYRQWCKEIVYPLVTQRSSGSRLWDVDGHELVDITNGFGMVMFGHNPSFVREALQSQLAQGYEIGPQSPLAASVARDLCAMVGLERAAFCSTGSEAVMAAIRLARTVTGRDTIVVFAGAYHGVFDEVLVRAGAAAGDQAQPSGAQPIAPGIPASMVQHVKVLEYGSAQALQTIRALGDSVAAVLVEPVQSRRPELQPREFLHSLRSLTQACGAALVFDEVVTGFRCHPGGAQALFGVKADLATYGKVLGGGLPIGVVAGSARFMDALDGGTWQFGDDSAPEVGVTFFAGTFVRHPLALAAARAVLTHLQAEGPQLQRSLNQRTTRLVQDLRETAQTLGVPLQVPHFASWFCLRLPADMPQASLFFAALRLHGLHVWEGRPCFLTTAHTDDDLQRIAQTVRTALIELQQAGLLPAPAPEVSDAPAAPSNPMPAEPPVPGARKGKDREGREAWFVPDPQRPGKFLQVLSGADGLQRRLQ